MICQASYDSLDQVPPEFKDDFEPKNGKYVMKADAIPGAAELLNPGLAANRDRALNQLKTANEVTIPQLKGKITELEGSQQDLAPGSRVLSPEDAKAWDRFNKLGSVKDVEATVAKVPALEKQVSEAALATSLEEYKNFGLNNDVLTDWISNTPGLTAITKDGQIQDPKNPKAVIAGKVPFLRIETEDPNTKKVTVEEKPLLDFAKATLPAWKYTALITPVVDAAAQGNGNTTPQTVVQPVVGQPVINGGVYIPNQSSAQSGTGGTGGGSGEKKNYAQKFNEERNKKAVNPFLPQTPAAGTAETK